MSNTNEIHDIQKIMESLPHRFPILLVDRVTEIGENGGKGYKNISVSEPVFQGHFPGRPIYPGVMIIEGMAQCGGYIGLKILEKKEAHSLENKLIFFMMIDKAKFRRPVVPGDKLEYEIEFIKLTKSITKFNAVAKVNGELAAEAELTAMIQDSKNK